jgi:hypothetical protein
MPYTGVLFFSNAMQLPASLAHISAEQDWQHTTPYPPLGFTSFYEGALGNGDTFGLYWPIGREAAEPIVVETWHDEWHIQPHFSSRTAFLQAYHLQQENYHCTSTLMQTYAELMSAETVSFQERYDFQPAAFIARQIDVSAKLAHGSHDPATLWLPSQA